MNFGILIGIHRFSRTESCSDEIFMSKESEIVYVVDDEAGMRKALTRLLRSEGFDVRAFASAGDFLAAYHAEETGCLVLDVGMPELDGIEFQRCLSR